MYSMWINPNVTYYVAKMFGYLPFAGSNKVTSLLYTSFLWICLSLSGVFVNVNNYMLIENAPLKYKMMTKVVFIEEVFRSIVAITSTAFSVGKSKGYFDLQEKFYKFDKFGLRAQCPSDTCAQIFYLLYILFIGIYNFTCTIFYSRIAFPYLLMWNLLCLSTLLAVVQYVVHVRMLRQRFKLVNGIFTNSVLKNSSHGINYCNVYPKEINSLLIEIRGLTEEVKTYYAYHAILIVIESAITFVSSVTTLTVNYLHDFNPTFIFYGYFIGHCTLRLLFLFLVVRETHTTVLETKNTALICHEALSISLEVTAIKYLELILLNFWNHSIIFNVNDFFDLDYKLLQSIIASVVTYVVVLVQIQLVIMDI